MKLSIIIPTYNRNDLLGKCLTKLDPKTQGYEGDYEIIVTDDSKEHHAQNFIKKEYPWVKWVEGPHKGPAANRNNGAENTDGEWIVFIDDDCLPDKALVESYAQEAKKQTTIKVFEGSIISDREKRHYLEEAPVNGNGGHLWSCNFMIEKNIFLNKLKGFDESFPFAAMEDVDLHTRIKKAGYEIVFVKEAIVVHPWRLQTNFLKVTEQRTISAVELIKKHPELEETNSLLSRMKFELRFYIKEVVLHLLKYRGRGVITFIKAHILSRKTYNKYMGIT